jgi:hypothetical protein
MKGIAAIAVAMVNAAVGASWFFSNPSVVTVRATPMQSNPALPTFKEVQEQIRRDAR